jgi:Protein of unknown function (DUF1194)
LFLPAVFIGVSVGPIFILEFVMMIPRLLRTALCLAPFLAASAARAACVDLALALAVDASGSIDEREYTLQVAGYATALASPEVLRAIESAGRVSVTVLIWGDENHPVQIIAWREVRDADDAREIGMALLGMERRVSGNTGLGRGVEVALQELETGAPCAARRVIDVSGDGRESVMPRVRVRTALAPVRVRALDKGVTINGLAITSDDPGLGEYYRLMLIAGPGSFVEEVASFDDFAAALTRKLVREIAPPELASIAPTP